MAKIKGIMGAALDCARDKGYMCMTRSDVAEYAACAPSLVSSYYGTMDELRAQVLRYAVLMEDYHVIAQGLVMGEIKKDALTREVLQGALYAICNGEVSNV